MRGCFLDWTLRRKRISAFPAYAGMFPWSFAAPHLVSSFPRVCGDVSSPQKFLDALDELSPRMRGCFQNQAPQVYFVVAFPAYAGMFLWAPDYIFSGASFPRVCGDVSQHLFSQIPSTQAFPAYAGMFPITPMTASPSVAFPAYAGMFPALKASQTAEPGFPRVCGDVSSPAEFLQALNELSPRMRGCF